MKIKVLNTPDLIMPKQGTIGSSGFDICASDDPEIVGEQWSTGTWKSIDYIQYRTNLVIDPNNDGFKDRFKSLNQTYHTLVHPRSSISKYNLILANGIPLIDGDYRGEILLRFKYIWQPADIIFLDPDKYPQFVIQVNKDKIYKQGDKIGQLVFEESITNVQFEIVEELENTERGDGGFGHTDGK